MPLPASSKRTGWTSTSRPRPSRRTKFDSGLPSMSANPWVARIDRIVGASFSSTTRSTSWWVRVSSPSRASTPQPPSSHEATPAASRASRISMTSAASAWAVEPGLTMRHSLAPLVAVPVGGDRVAAGPQPGVRRPPRGNREPLVVGARRGTVQPLDDVATYYRAVLEPVPRTAADEPDVVEVRVAIDDEVRVGRGLVLADARLDDRLVEERREPPLRVASGEPRGVGIDEPLAA